MNSLASRKQLLIVESELNRAQLVQEWQTLADEAHALARKAGTISALASIAASLVAGVAFFRRKKPAPAAGKNSRWQNLLNGVGLVSSIWSALRPQGRGQMDK